MAPYPLPPPPIRRTSPPADPGVLEPSPELPLPERVTVPEVRIPPPDAVPLPPPLETRPPPAPNIPRKRPRAPAPRRAPPIPKWVRVGQNIGLGTVAASILRPILRRQTEEPRLDLQSLLQPQLVRPDVVSPGEVRDRFGEVVPPGLAAEPLGGLADLTSLNTRALGFASTVPQTARARDEQCECEKTEEEEEEDRERNRSNVVANVKTYRRRMSQNSLDNLRKG
jgi:hypothetical protein